MNFISWWQAILLGLVQGLTEFIPVSSSAHLNITHWFLGQARNVTFDVMLHMGTLCALAWYFRRDWAALIFDKAQRKLRDLILLACVPAVIAGVLLRDAEDKVPIFTDVQFNAVMLIVMGAVLWLADVIGRKTRVMQDIRVPDALLIGASQALALVPGVSRSGATITMGLLRGLDRETAARFSFLMSLPITIGAFLFEVRGVLKEGTFTTSGAGVMLLGMAVAALSGYFAIDFLLNYLRKRGLGIFFWWRLAVALLVFARLYQMR